MLKIYRAINFHGNIKLEDNIKFKHGRFDTGLHGFGEIKSANPLCETANYEFTNLNCFEDYVKQVKKEDGFVKDFVFWNPKSYEMLSKELKNVKTTIEQFSKYKLNEEAILLLTDMVYLRSENKELIELIFGRNPGTALYLLKPNASFNMRTNFFINNQTEQNYEVLQSQSLGKRLVLEKMDRKIY